MPLHQVCVASELIEWWSCRVVHSIGKLARKARLLCFPLPMATLLATTPPPLYYYPQWKAYECLACRQVIEIPRYATLMVDGKMQRVKVLDNPEHLLIWRELHEIDHERCGSFKDEAKAKDAREHRRETR